MGELQLQPIYSGLDSKWSPNLLKSHPLERIQTKEEFLSKGNLLDGSGNPRDAEFQCNRDWKQFNNIEPNKHCTQEGFGSISLYSRPKEGQFRNKGQFLQDGQHSKMFEICSEGNVGNKDRPEEGLLPRSNQGETSQSPWIQVQGQDLSVQMPTVWAKSSSQKFHKDYERVGDQVEKAGYSSIYLHRRYFDSKQQQRNYPTAHRHSHEGSRDIGMDNPEREKRISTVSTHRVSRSGTGSRTWPCENPSQQTINSLRNDSKILISKPTEQVCSMQESSTIPRKDGISNSFKPLLCSLSFSSS